MAKSKYETHVLPNLERIAKWAEQGATAKDIAAKLKIAYSTFRRYIDLGEKGDEKYQALSVAFARACEIPDDAVEAALYKRACGFTYDEETVEEKMIHGEIIELRKTIRKTIPPDPTSAMFWLTNRRPKVWSYKPEAAEDEDDDNTGVVMLPAIMEGESSEAAATAGSLEATGKTS